VLELYREIARMAGSGAVTPAELARERDGEVRALPALFATGGDVLATYRTLIRLGLPLDFYATLGDRVRGVAAGEVAAAARAHLTPDRLAVVVVGDGGAVLPGLREIVASGAIAGIRELVVLDPDARPLR